MGRAAHQGPIRRPLDSPLPEAAFPEAERPGAKGHQDFLLEPFPYPKYGPGQLWEEVARDVQRLGGQVLTEWAVESLAVEQNRVVSLTARHSSRNDRGLPRRLFLFDHARSASWSALSTAPPAVSSRSPTAWFTATSSPSACS